MVGHTDGCSLVQLVFSQKLDHIAVLGGGKGLIVNFAE